MQNLLVDFWERFLSSQSHILTSIIAANSTLNSDPLSKVIFLGHGYLDNHACSTAWATVCASLLGICFISNQEVAGSIIVTYHMVEYFFLTSFDLAYFLIGILYGPIRSTHNWCHGTTSGSFAGSRPYFFLFTLQV